MKTKFVLMLVFSVFAVSVFAQKSQLTKKLQTEEVPVAIIQSLEKDYSALASEKGTWTLMYTENMTTGKLTADFYTYSCKTNNEKVVLFYKQDGTLDHTKGIAAPAATGAKN